MYFIKDNIIIFLLNCNYYLIYIISTPLLLRVTDKEVFF